MNLREAKILLEKHGANGLRDLLYKFKDYNPDDLYLLNPEDFVMQPKWDGWFTATLVENGIGTMYSRTKRYRENLYCEGLKEEVYFGELIGRGQQRLFGRAHETEHHTLHHCELYCPRG